MTSLVGKHSCTKWHKDYWLLSGPTFPGPICPLKFGSKASRSFFIVLCRISATPPAHLLPCRLCSREKQLHPLTTARSFIQRESRGVFRSAAQRVLPKGLLTPRISKFNLVKHRLHGTLQSSAVLSSPIGSFVLEDFHLFLSDRC